MSLKIKKEKSRNSKKAHRSMILLTILATPVTLLTCLSITRGNKMCSSRASGPINKTTFQFRWEVR